MITCDWEGCGNAALPLPVATGHHLCEYHLAAATAVVRDGQRRLAATPAQTVPAVLVKRRRPLGRKVPPILFGIVMFCTVMFPFRWPLTHLVLMFSTFLVVCMWWFWQWANKNDGSRPVPPGRG